MLLQVIMVNSGFILGLMDYYKTMGNFPINVDFDFLLTFSLSLPHLLSKDIQALKNRPREPA